MLSTLIAVAIAAPWAAPMTRTQTRCLAARRRAAGRWRGLPYSAALPFAPPASPTRAPSGCTRSASPASRHTPRAPAAPRRAPRCGSVARRGTSGSADRGRAADARAAAAAATPSDRGVRRGAAEAPLSRARPALGRPQRGKHRRQRRQAAARARSSTRRASGGAARTADRRPRGGREASPSPPPTAAPRWPERCARAAVRAAAVAAGCAAGGTHVLEDRLGFGERHRGVAIERQVGDALSELRERLKTVGPQLRDLSERLDGGAAVGARVRRDARELVVRARVRRVEGEHVVERLWQQA